MSRKPQIIAANKLDLMSEEERDEVLMKLRDRFENDSVKVFPISAATGEGLKGSVIMSQRWYRRTRMKGAVFEQEYFPEYHVAASSLTPYPMMKRIMNMSSKAHA